MELTEDGIPCHFSARSEIYKIYFATTRNYREVKRGTVLKSENKLREILGFQSPKTVLKKILRLLRPTYSKKSTGIVRCISLTQKWSTMTMTETAELNLVSAVWPCGFYGKREIAMLLRVEKCQCWIRSQWFWVAFGLDGCNGLQCFYFARSWLEVAKHMIELGQDRIGSSKFHELNMPKIRQSDSSS